MVERGGVKIFDLSKEEDRNKQNYAFALSEVEMRNKQE